MQEKREIQLDADANISPEEKAMLDSAFETNSYSIDEQQLASAELDNKDDDGTPLNEESMADDVSGKDLDVPGSEADDENEDIGKEDEENNSYSQADTE
ncbi:MAG: hypothetical protein ABIY51_05395 [Ferruginibacter sp.]